MGLKNITKRLFIKNFIISLCIVFIVAAIGGLVSYDPAWYNANKPSFSPPNYLFGIVWPILYFLIALSLAIVWTKAKKSERKKIAISYGINLIANSLWTLLFFGLKMPFAAFIDIAIIWLTIISMIFIAWKIDRRAGWLLVPYLLWVSFAALLNASFL